MQIAETAAVLAKIQAYTNRSADKNVILAWHEILEPYELQDCLRAVADHYRNSKDWIMPSDITAKVAEYRDERLRAFGNGLRLTEEDEAKALDAGGSAWRDAIKGLHRLAANGHMTPEAYEAYRTGKIQLNAITRKEITN